MPVITRLIEIVAEATAPTLTSPTGTSTGTTTATGAVTTDEGNGTLYYLASANATETAGAVIASGQSQAVSATGVQNVSLTGLTPASVYYLHYVHRDAANNASARVSSSSFSTSTTGTVITRLIEIVSAGDTTAPTLTSPAATATGPTTASGTVSTDEANGTLFRLVSANATELASTVIASGQSQVVSGTGVQSVTFTGLVAETAYYAHYVHRDASNNASARVTSTQFTTSAAAGGGVITRLIAVTAQADSISSVSGSTAGSTTTVTTGGIYNLYTDAPTLTYGGAACTAITVTGANTFTARMPTAGFALGSSNNFVLNVRGTASAPVARTFNSALGRYATLTVPFTSFPPDSWARDNELVGAVEGLTIGDQNEISLKSSGTTSTPEGYDAYIDGLGNLWLEDPAGSEGNLAAETESVTVTVALIDASDSYSRSNVMTVALVLNAPNGTLTLDAPAYASTTAILGFNWTGTNATGFQYRVNGGSWTAIPGSPIALTGLTADTPYQYDVRAVNGASTGDIVSGSFTTQGATDLIPDPVVFTPQSGVQISTSVISNSVTVTGIVAATDISVSITGGEYSVSTDGGTTWGAWTSAAGNVQLNHRVRVRLTSSGNYTTPSTATLLLADAIEGGFTVTTRADDVAPVVALNGIASMPWPLGTPWVDPGATALDNVDGPLDATADTAPNVNAAGAYTITYTATDAAGNNGSAIRVVTVAAAGDVPTYPFRRTVAWEGGVTPTLVIGDTFRNRITLESSGAAYNLFTATEVQACVVSLDHSTAYNTVVELALEADWVDGIVTILMNATSTTGIAEFVTAEAFAWMEIQVTLGGEKTTWFAPVRVVPGLIP
jgi:hypothetical protein